MSKYVERKIIPLLVRAAEKKSEYICHKCLSVGKCLHKSVKFSTPLFFSLQNKDDAWVKPKPDGWTEV